MEEFKMPEFKMPKREYTPYEQQQLRETESKECQQRNLNDEHTTEEYIAMAMQNIAGCLMLGPLHYADRIREYFDLLDMFWFELAREKDVLELMVDYEEAKRKTKDLLLKLEAEAYLEL